MPISPPPWTVEPYDQLWLQVVAKPGAVGARDVVALVDGPDREANARLIAAAPSLAAAIRRGDWAGAVAIVERLDAGG